MISLRRPMRSESEPAGVAIERVDQVERDQHPQDADDAQSALLRPQHQEGVGRIAQGEEPDDAP